MKTDNYSNVKSDISIPESSKNLMSRREALNKAGVYALTTATMMVLMKSQAKAATSYPTAIPIEPNSSTKEWRRTTRN